MGKSSPQAPDPVATAKAQAAANKEAVLASARVNQMREVTPFGTLEYTGKIGSPERTRTTTLSPETQRQFDVYSQMADLLGGTAINRAQSLDQGPFQLQGLQQLPEDFSGDRRRIEEETFGRAMELMNPQFERTQSRFEQQMANRGIPIGGEAYGSAYKQMVSDPRQQAEMTAALDALQSGGAEQSRLYGLSQSARQQGINEQLLQRQQPMNELAALLQGSPALSQPQFGAASQYQIAPADIMGAMERNYQNQMSNYQNQMGGLYGLAGTLGSAFMFPSDKRLKTDIRKIGELPNGLGWYEFRYNCGGPKVTGVIAQEILEKMPEAVHKAGDFLVVDYGEVLEWHPH